MTPENLKEVYESAHAARKQPVYYFHPDTMKFFGDTMSNFKVIEEVIPQEVDGVMVDVEYWVLCRKRLIKKSYRPAGPMAWFRKSDLKCSSDPRKGW